MSVRHRRGSPSRLRAARWGPPTAVEKVLLACGPLSGLVYVVWHEAAALRWEGYSRAANAISELSLTGAPSKAVLEPWEGIVHNGLLVAFGIGVWRSAGTRRAPRVIGALQVLSGATLPLWMLFSESGLGAHLALSAVGILTWLGSMVSGAAAFGRRFRVYSLVSLVVVVAFFALAFTYVPEATAGEPMPFIGLDERIAFSAYFLWQSVLAAVLWRGRAGRPPAGGA